ncbi:MAG: hypothetical protein WC599_09010, partial [Bacteroidales bacterium]
VLGIVFPLFLLSLSYEKFSKKISGQNRQKIYTVLKYLGASVFIISGILIAIFNYFNKIEMNQMEGYSKQVRLLVFEIAKRFQNPLLDISVFLLFVFIFYKLLRYGAKQNK